MTRVRGVRGATTAESNTREAIISATKELLERVVEENAIRIDDLAAAFFTTTEDLNAEFPALAARQMGWGYVALLGGQEISVPDAQAKCIRVLLMLNTDKAPQELTHVYLRGASSLRDRGIEEV
jgi:chorismate mutase